MKSGGKELIYRDSVISFRFVTYHKSRHLVRDRRRVVLAPLGNKRLLLFSGRRELEVARLLRDHCALVHGLQVGRQFRAVLADLLRVQVAHLLGHVDHARHLLVVALLGALLSDAPGAADLSRQFKRTDSQERSGRMICSLFAELAQRHSKVRHSTWKRLRIRSGFP